MTTVKEIINQDKLENDILELNTTSVHSCKTNIGYQILNAAWTAIRFSDEVNQDILKRIDVVTKKFEIYPSWAKEIASFLINFNNEDFITSLKSIYNLDNNDQDDIEKELEEYYNSKNK